MKSNIDEKKLTAYALGELHGEEAKEIEALAARDPEAAAFIASTRALGQDLKRELSAEPMPVSRPRARRRLTSVEITFAALGVLLAVFLIRQPLGRWVTKHYSIDHATDESLTDAPADGRNMVAVLEALAQRATDPVTAGECEFALPRLGAEDRRETPQMTKLEGQETVSVTTVYERSIELIAGSGAGAVPQEGAGVTVTEALGFRSVLRQREAALATIFRHAISNLRFHCWVSAQVHGAVPAHQREKMSAALRALLEKIGASVKIGP